MLLFEESTPSAVQRQSKRHLGYEAIFSLFCHKFKLWGKINKKKNLQSWKWQHEAQQKSSFWSTFEGKTAHTQHPAPQKTSRKQYQEDKGQRCTSIQLHLCTQPITYLWNGLNSMLPLSKWHQVSKEDILAHPQEQQWLFGLHFISWPPLLPHVHFPFTPASKYHLPSQ